MNKVDISAEGIRANQDESSSVNPASIGDEVLDAAPQILLTSQVTSLRR